VSSVAFSPDDKTLASVSDEIKLWDLATGKEKATIAGGGLFVAWSADGKTLFTCDADGAIKLWDVAKGKEKAVLRGIDSFNSAALSPNGKTLAVAGGPIRLWDVSPEK